MITGEKVEDFHGLVMPPGEEKKILYQSQHRMIATYAMAVEALDHELKHILEKRGSIIKEDSRRNCCGQLEVVTKGNKVVHMMMDKCSGSSQFVQLRYWVDF
ncbi:hypothetical protein Ctob_010910 [Chrysochromulina tobinii]|uniref:Uncharacterized protein n=1 Tax=Chrysochromulina tobinii TaxID=1460289 RepID=A0A0M0JNX0_9EUKA|nr:hypothetical protein Ctob_010910 [Chrysochromulina tobinii]|eukprot:KOO28294.1 hypothetical protein Ctob_010910 [Chrysochromulina sp. CCMP291]